MKLKYDFESIRMDKDIVLVPVGEGADQIHGVLKANKEGEEIIYLLKNDTTEEQVVEILMDKYENKQDILAGYVKKTIEALRQASLLEE